MYTGVDQWHEPVYRAFEYFDGMEIHYRHAGDAAAPVLLCLHASPVSSVALVPLVSALGRSFRVLAPDTLGNGDSRGPIPRAPDIGFYADVCARFLERRGVDRCAVYGTHTGASIAMELARRGGVTIDRLILDGVGLYDAGFQREILENYIPEFRADASGAYLIELWSMLRDMYLFWPWFSRRAASRRDVDLPPPHVMHLRFVEVLKAYDTFGRSYKAAFRFDKRAVLAELEVPVLVTSVEQDMLSPHDAEILDLLPHGVARRHRGYASAETAAATADLFRAFLSGEMKTP